MITLTRDQHRLLTAAARHTGLVYTTGTAAWHTTSRPLNTAGTGTWRAPARRCDQDVAQLVDAGLITPRRTAGPYEPTRAGERYLSPPSLPEMVQRARAAVRARATLPDSLSATLGPLLDAVDDMPALTALLTGELIPCRLCQGTPVFDPTGFAQHHMARHANRIVTTTRLHIDRHTTTRRAA